MSIFGTPEERERRKQEREAEAAAARQKLKGKLLALWSMIRQLPTAIQVALIGMLGIILGNIMGLTTSEAQTRQTTTTATTTPDHTLPSQPIGYRDTVQGTAGP